MLTAAGMPRMPARVMMALVGSPDEGYSAAELAERLGVSAAAVSGRFATCRRSTSSTGSHARVTAATATTSSTTAGTRCSPRTRRCTRCLADLIDAVADENVEAPQSTERARDMSAFFRFFAERMPAFLDEWEAERRARPDSDQPSGVSVDALVEADLVPVGS